ncbi:MAG: DNA-3-methyladenine glycosylase family protein [Saezia sp.]
MVQGLADATRENLTCPTPEYWGQACKHLSGRDRIMRRLIEQHPDVSLESRGNAFVTLARSIVGQQITVKAAQTIWDRFVLAVARGRQEPTPEEVLAVSFERMRDAGLSKRKVEYMQDLAVHFAEEKLSPLAWHEMDDEAIILELTKVRGIGRWTAEMFLIFHLLRPNVFPLDDIGLMRGISQNYFSGEPVSRAEARELSEAWMPYRTVAIWYLWRSLDPLPVTY